MLEELLNIFFPERCIGCEKQGSILCALCERTITTKPRALSSWCGTLYDYRNPLVKKAIWSLKYHRKKSLGKYFGIALYREFFKHLTHERKAFDQPIILIPIPASAKALAMRGYNHSNVIAQTIGACAERDAFPLHVRDDILHKKRENIRQVEAGGKKEREGNIKAVFEVRNGEDLRGKTIVLIDDVTTTGATISEARKKLKEWGPKRVLALAVAH